MLAAQIQSISGVECDIVVLDSSGRELVDDDISFSTLEKGESFSALTNRRFGLLAPNYCKEKM